MRNLILFSIICYTLFTGIYVSNAFLGDEYSLNMYENIDEGIDDLEETLYIKQLRTDKRGNTIDISEKITELIFTDSDALCIIDSELSGEDIKNLEGGRIDKLFQSIKEECKGINDELSVEMFLEYYSTIRQFSIDSRDTAQKQAKVISEIARLGIYSDGDDDNSPFDLITDLQNINNIIFSKEIPYLGTNSNSLFSCLYGDASLGPLDHAERLTSIAQSIADKDDKYNECKDIASSFENVGQTFELDGLSSGVEANAEANGDGDTSIIDLPAGDAFPISGDGQNLVCIDSSQTSGLAPEVIEQITDTEDNRPGFVPTTAFIGIEPLSYIDDPDNEETDEYTDVEYPESNYSKMKDNDRWPCNEYFCIRVEFVTETYDLLIGGKTKSIESLINTSNQHLKKFANTSLVQSKMTTNNFEISWRDLNLPDLFHAGVQIQFVPPPILNLDKVNGQDDPQKQEISDDFSVDNLLRTYFKYHDLDYDRENDLQIFVDTDAERKSISNSQQLSLNATKEEFETARKYKENSKTNFARSILDKKTNNTDIEEFYLQFAEIERFSSALKDYAFAAAAIIQKMKEIPVKSNG